MDNLEAPFCALFLLALSSCSASSPSSPDPRPVNCGRQPGEVHETVDFPAPEAPRGVFVVVHGLNNKPESMDSLISELHRLGFSVIRAALHGHGARGWDKYGASRERWLRNVEFAYCQAQRLYPGMPVNILAYSAGAAAAVDFLMHTEGFFRKAVFIAPAWSLRPKTVLVRPLRFIGGLPVPLLSLAPARYRRHLSPAPAMYAAIFDVVDEIAGPGEREKLNSVDALVLLSPTDTLVDPQGVRKWVKAKSIERWEIKEVDVDSGYLNGFGHALLDESGAGSGGWRVLTEAVREHLSKSDDQQ